MSLHPIGSLGYHLFVHHDQGAIFYLSLILDLFGRKLVGREIYDLESLDYAAETVSRAVLKEGKKGPPVNVVLHSDNGSPMKGASMLGTLQKMGIRPSFGRPLVSNDNAFSEALFRTLKYRPDYPAKPFDSLEEGWQWVQSFIR